MKRLPNLRFRSFLPSTSGITTLVLVALGVSLAGFACSLAYGLSSAREEALENGSFVLGFLTLLPVAVLIDVGAWLEKRPLPRAALGATATLVAALAGVVGSVSIRSSDTEVWPLYIFCLPVALVISAPAIHALTKLPRYLRHMSHSQRVERVRDILASQAGEATYEDLSQALGISEDEVDRLLIDLMKTGKIPGTRKTQYGRFYTLAALKAKQRRLVRFVKARGKVGLDELVAELDAPRGLVEEWIYRLVDKGRFTGYINWDERVLYSAEVKELREGGRCPTCGGDLEIAGKGVIRCEHCGAEIFL